MPLSYRVFNELFQWIPILTDKSPGPGDQGSWMKKICAWKESLAMLVCTYHESLRNHIDLWVLNVSGEHKFWSKIFTIFNPFYRIARAIGMWRDREAIFLVEDCSDKLCLSDIIGQ